MMIDQTLRYSLIVSVLLCALVGIVFGAVNALALFAGVVWGGINLYLIASIVESLLISHRYVSAGIMMVVKFPLLYGAGYFLLNVHVWNLWFLLAGPPLAFLVMAINAIWRHSVRSV